MLFENAEVNYAIFDSALQFLAFSC